MYSKLLRRTTALSAKSARVSFLRRRQATLRFRLLEQRRQPSLSLSQQYGVSQRRFFFAAEEEARQQGGGGGGGSLFLYLAVAAAGGAGVAYYQQYPPFMDALGLPYDKKSVSSPASSNSSVVDYTKVRALVADIMDDFDYDEGVGSYGPVFVRLAWHSSGTYDKNAGNGGSNGATMRFAPESEHGANAGLHVAREKLEEVKKEFPDISYADLWTLASVVAIEEMGGPKIPWRPGRTDAKSADACPPDGRLPDGDKGNDHQRGIFTKMGFNDQEMTALVGAHALGKCHKDRSGFDGLWTRSPTTFSNEFYKLILNEKWTKRQWDGPLQYENPEKDLMMLEADLAFASDPKFRKWSELYASDQAKWHEDFSAAYAKLLELGCTF